MVQEFKWVTEEASKDQLTKNSISKKAKIIKMHNTEILKNSEGVKYSDIWGVRPIFDAIVSYVDNKNLAQFNVVSKKIHELTNPIVHKSLKLLRYIDIRDKKYNGFAATERREAEINECIKNNSKYAHLVKQIALSTHMKPAKTIEFFTTFKFLTKLDICEVSMTQGQFIKMIKLLAYLQELNLNNFWITERNKNLIKKRDMQLPSTLTKLFIDRLYYYDNPTLFFQFISSHDNLTEFKFAAGNFFDVFDPFQKNYSSLKKFEYINSKLENYEDLLNFIKLNTQLHSLHLELDCLNEKFAEYINQYLVNLEELQLRKFRYPSRNNPPLILKFNCPTKIKKLKLNCEDLNESSLNSILANCPYLIELEVFLPYDWKFWCKSISTKCNNLKKLTIFPSLAVYKDDKVSFAQKFYNSDFLLSSSTIASTLTHLTLYYYSFIDSKDEYFNAFKLLKFIKFAQLKQDDYKIDAWPSYSIRKSRNNYKIDIELTKVQ